MWDSHFSKLHFVVGVKFSTESASFALVGDAGFEPAQHG